MLKLTRFAFRVLRFAGVGCMVAVMFLPCAKTGAPKLSTLNHRKAIAPHTLSQILAVFADSTLRLNPAKTTSRTTHCSGP